ncbi:PREDICTED: surfeit locus protein 4 homolog [Branchiostoma belcheri]|uniref:Surfeit locus protein 4 homolog n=1 Tax=Branchiostoma belcheri TaxID=7741 RepID=A0A6P4YQ91_BRABE|nr:PREDICTED: surfeit locus protein 4 homolog [Branchiostoma belcheri]
MSSESGKFTDRVRNVAETVWDVVFRFFKRNLPVIARLLLMMTFFDDGLRMIYNWTNQTKYFEHSWDISATVAGIAVSLNMVGQLVGCGLVLARRKVEWGCGILFTNVIFQAVMYEYFKYAKYILRSLSLTGCVLLLLLDHWAERKSMDPGLLKVKKEDRTRMLLQLAGRCLVGFMFVSLAQLGPGYPILIITMVGYLLLLCVMVGYRTRQCAIILAIQFFLVTLVTKTWWLKPWDSTSRDFVKYEFFQAMSAVGGLLQEAVVGPGRASLDERKKDE